MFCLQPGDKVGIVTPASFIRQGDIDSGLHYLQSLGLIPVLGQHVYNEWRYMGGTAEQRAADLMSFYRDDSIKAIFTSRGGGGGSYILPHLDYELIKANPKPLFGLSDITILQNAVYAQSGCPSYTGMILKQDMKDNAYAMLSNDFQNLINGNEMTYTGGQTVAPGYAEGTLIGGNLTALSYLFGTTYMPELSGKILLLEDIGGKSFWIDLRLQQLRQTPGFDKLQGIIFGEFSDCAIIDKEDGSPDEIIDTFCQNLTIPVIKHFPYGHIPARHILPVGLPVKLNADDCSVRF